MWFKGKGKSKGKDTSKRKQIFFRYAIVLGLLMLLVGAVVYKLVDTTIINADKWNHKADSVLNRVWYVQPLRGDILADDGSVLATNITKYEISLDYRTSAKQDSTFVACLDSLCDSLAHYYPVRTRDEWRLHLSKPLAKPRAQRTMSCMLLKRADYDDYERILTFPFFNQYKPSQRNKHGLCANPVQERMAPFGPMAHRSIGRCNRTPAPKFIGASRKADTVYVLTGYSGLEAALDSLLRGRVGKAKIIPLTQGVSRWPIEQQVDGYTLRTTINIEMQDIVESELQSMLERYQADWGTAILMHVPTGDIKAISNLERDANGQYIEAMNRAMRGVEPGSVMKPISMIIAMRHGWAFPLSKTYSIGSTYAYAGGPPIHDTHSPGGLPVSRFIEYSSNIGMTKLLAPNYSDVNAFREDLREIGFLDTLGTGMLGERPPYFPTLDPKAGGHVSLSRMTYGYSSRIPPLYTCAIYNAIANKGKFVRPRLVTEYITRDGQSQTLPITYVRDSILSPANAGQLLDMLHSVVYGEGGTAKALKNDTVTLVGKTGTSYIVYEGANDENGKWVPARPPYYTDRQRLAFCGIFPYENPQYTCMVVISNPKTKVGAARSSGKVVQDIAMKLYSHGMLGRYSDIAANPNRSAAPTFYASAAPGVRSTLGSEYAYQFGAPSPVPAGTVPDVLGLGVRQALARLETAGYNMQPHGQGYAVSQTPAPGTALAAGQTVTVNFVTKK